MIDDLRRWHEGATVENDNLIREFGSYCADRPLPAAEAATSALVFPADFRALCPHALVGLLKAAGIDELGASRLATHNAEIRSAIRQCIGEELGECTQLASDGMPEKRAELLQWLEEMKSLREELLETRDRFCDPGSRIAFPLPGGTGIRPPGLSNLCPADYRAVLDATGARQGWRRLTHFICNTTRPS